MSSIDSACGIASNRNGPTIDPANVRAPPTTTMVNSNIEESRSNDDGSMKLRNVAYIPPAMPANAPANAAADTFARNTFLPAAATASSSSRIARSSRPNGARMISQKQPHASSNPHKHSAISWNVLLNSYPNTSGGGMPGRPLAPPVPAVQLVNTAVASNWMPNDVTTK